MSSNIRHTKGIAAQRSGPRFVYRGLRGRAPGGCIAAGRTGDLETCGENQQMRDQHYAGS